MVWVMKAARGKGTWVWDMTFFVAGIPLKCWLEMLVKEEVS
jgi:hypothetical protein